LPRGEKPPSEVRTCRRATVLGLFTTVQISGVLHGCIACHLLHPARVRMACNATQRYPSAAGPRPAVREARSTSAGRLSW
jgi:hypothetical protein